MRLSAETLHKMYIQNKRDVVKDVRIETISKLYKDNILSDNLSYKEKREIANQLDWSIGILHGAIEDYKKEQKAIKEIEKQKKRNRKNNEKK